MSDKKKQTQAEVATQAPATGIRLQPSTATYKSCMELTALALGYPADKPLRSSPNMFVLSLTGLGSSPAVTTLGTK
jgi:hypothetical protein